VVTVRAQPSARPPGAPAATRLVRTGWVMVALLPVAFVAASVLGDWLLSRQGHDSGDPDLPLGVVLRAGLPALLLVLTPLGLTVWCGWRVRGRGDRRGIALMVVGSTLGLGLLFLNLAPLLISALL